MSSVVDLFEGAITWPIGGLIGQASGSKGHSEIHLDESAVIENLARITEREGVGRQSALALKEGSDLQGTFRKFPNFSIEMETGTGKTYVYISTALRLAELYGLRKFVVLVHSVAIRAGAVKTFEQTSSHFHTKYPGLPYRWGVLGEGSALDDFIEPSSAVQFLIVSVQAIDKPESNAVYQEAEQPQMWTDSMSGINAIASVKPVVIIDEPQNMATELRHKAIATLNPLMTLRYSATHREPFNMVHRLGPKAARDAGLVKQVSVKGIVAGDSGRPYLLVTKLRSVHRHLMAEAVIDKSTATGVSRNVVVLQNGSNLFDESGGIEVYRGLTVERFERRPDRVVFENGTEIAVGSETGIDRSAIWSDQIRHTIRHHFQREDQIVATGREIKVLSLFFVARVADYVGADAPLPQMFDRLFREEWVRAGRHDSSCPNAGDVRIHYFPSTKTGIYKDTTGGNASDAEFEARAYEEIIEHKERIITKSLSG